MSKFKISESKLNSFLNKLFMANPHPLIEGSNVIFKSALQISSSPLKIKIFTNYPDQIEKNYKIFLIDEIKKNFGISDITVSLVFAFYNITRFEIADSIHNEFGLPKKDCIDLVGDILDIIIEGLQISGKVKIHNFGTFSIKNKKSRIGRNPKTKEEVMIGERKVVSFKASKNVLKYLNSLNA